MTREYVLVSYSLRIRYLNTLFYLRSLQKYNGLNYNFELNPAYQLDSVLVGNCTRYANHSAHINIIPAGKMIYFYIHFLLLT